MSVAGPIGGRSSRRTAPRRVRRSVGEEALLPTGGGRPSRTTLEDAVAARADDTCDHQEHDSPQHRPADQHDDADHGDDCGDDPQECGVHGGPLVRGASDDAPRGTVAWTHAVADDSTLKCRRAVDENRPCRRRCPALSDSGSTATTSALCGVMATPAAIDSAADRLARHRDALLARLRREAAGQLTIAAAAPNPASAGPQVVAARGVRTRSVSPARSSPSRPLVSGTNRLSSSPSYALPVTATMVTRRRTAIRWWRTPSRPRRTQRSSGRSPISVGHGHGA